MGGPNAELEVKKPFMSFSSPKPARGPNRAMRKKFVKSLNKKSKMKNKGAFGKGPFETKGKRSR